jgi:ABC-type glutathione transport system ATPase component
MHPGLQALVRDTDKLVGQYEAREKSRQTCVDAVAALTAEVSLLGLTDAALTALLQQTSAANLKAIEELVTSGLQAVFDDLSLTFHFEVSTERNQQALTPVLASHGKVEGPILDSHGGGPAQVVALLLRLLTVHRLGLFPFVVLDESLNMVSDQYVANAAVFLKGLCQRLGLTLLLVTHKYSFAEEATRAYEIASGPSGATFRDITRGV